jgi:NADPH:quinone reductase-like Zn-dependent oxidoreductase
VQAIVYTQYGPPDVLRLTDVAQPTPKDNDVLVKVHAASVNAGDWHLLRGDPFVARLSSGLRRPKHTILGADIAGQVVAIGRRVTQFRVGDAVYGDVSGCGSGGFAEYLCAPETVLALKPAKLTMEHAAAVPMAAVTALQGLRDKGRIQAGQQVLINGASGGVGTFAVQIAKSFGAEVTAVCSTRNIAMARSLGANHVIDYTEEDFARLPERYDLILAANGARTLADYRRVLKPKGRCVISGGAGSQIAGAMFLGPLFSLTGGVTITSLLALPSQRDLTFLSGLLEAGDVVPVIDRCYPLAEVPDAIRYVEDGHARGKVLIVVHAVS